MYIKNISISNLGPIREFNLDLPFDNQGKPLPVVLVGTNGSGKTLLLANILDSFIEMKRRIFTKLKEVDINDYLKVGQKSYINVDADTNHINVTFSMENNSTFSYVDTITHLAHSDFIKKYPGSPFKGLDPNNQKFQDNGFFKDLIHFNISNIQKEWKSSVICYFPHSRYDHPAWLTKSYDVGLEISEKFIGQDSESIIKKSNIQEVESWLLDVLLDRALYERPRHQVHIKTGENQYLPIDGFIDAGGKNSSILQAMNNILTTIFKEKFPDIQYVRIGATQKHTRQVSIILHYPNGKETTIARKFSYLSSGESLLISLFGSILKSFDFKEGDNIANISGIVVIDEIDLHLHLSMMRKTLPELIKLFPKIQFIFSTHSPFLLLGLKEIIGDKFSLVEMPSGREIETHDFNETREAYDIFVRGYNDFYDTYNSLKETLTQSSKPLIITEGKTDWKHIKNALSHFKGKGQYDNLDVDFLEYEKDTEMGDSALKQLCMQYCKVSQPRKIICLFDFDNENIIPEVSTTGNNYKDWNNNVYSLCIPKPSHREGYEKISIEFYYTDDELRTNDPVSNTRLFFSNEINELITKDLTKKKTVKSYQILDKPILSVENSKQIFDHDCDKIEDSEGNGIAHSKSAFADKVYNHSAGYDSFNLDSFKAIIDKIEKISLSGEAATKK